MFTISHEAADLSSHCVSCIYRDFVEQHYVTLKKSNPEFPILIRECSGVPARVWARYDFGKESSISVDNMSADQVASALHTLVQPKP
nr:PREDICTED: NADH dehydrogenase [ubiquinone] 1 alpha subcomplex subunit 2 [Paralichthys olivaceus]